MFAEYERDPSLATQPMLDLLMEVTLYSTQVLPYSQRDLFSMVSIVERSGDARYLLAMQKLAGTTETMGPYEKWQGEWREDIHDLAKAFVRKHAKAKSTPQYEPGTIDIDKLRADYVTAAVAAKHTPAQAANLRALPNAATLDDIFSAAGAPEVIDIGTQRGTYKGQRTRNENTMRFYYRGLGCVVLYYDKAAGWLLASVQIDPMRYERRMPYRARAAELGLPDEATLRMNELLSDSAGSIQNAIESAAPEEMSQEFADTAAEVLLRRFPEQMTSQEGDALIAICQALQRKDAERYSAVIEKVATESTDVRMRKVAYGGDAQPDPAKQYHAGDISLDAQRRRYPPIYPTLAVAP